ncbi:MAG: hypothetical protein JWO05_1228 [Gemmatimonadetes bacterium]|nr:hypothetical protein [Gemmatimonadota bacterium]
MIRRTVVLLAFAVARLGAQKPTGPIEDNSFLVEEAYNQERGVIQHINTLQFLGVARQWGYSFTEEWPAPGRRHQLSVTIPLGHNAYQSARLGDAALNYRFQLVDDSSVAFAPRASLVVPTGNWREGAGLGAPGAQWQLPLSVTLAPALVAHSNVGGTYTFNARVGDASRTDVTEFHLAQSLVWLARERFNFMLEGVWSRMSALPGGSATESGVISPGIRWGYDFENGLQVVPGIAFPIGVGPSRGQRGVFLYLSFEHPR